MHQKSCGRRRSGALLMWLGGILMAAALGLAVYNAWDEYRAAAAANAVVVELADTLDLGSSGKPCGFKSHVPYQRSSVRSPAVQ